MMKAINRKLPEDLITSIQQLLNPMIKIIPRSPTPQSNEFRFVSHVLNQSYARTVAQHADTLTVKGFNNCVYGEIKHTLVDEFIRRCGIKKGEVFLDMGSGIGNVCLQVSLTLVVFIS